MSCSFIGRTKSITIALSAIYKKNDYAISNHRCHAHYLSKDGSLFKMISELLGFKDGCSKRDWRFDAFS